MIGAGNDVAASMELIAYLHWSEYPSPHPGGPGGVSNGVVRTVR